MKILHVVHQYLPDDVGGTELYTQWIAEAQAAQGHEVHIFYRGWGEGQSLDRRTEAGLSVWRAQAGPRNATDRFLANFHNAPLDAFFAQVLDVLAPDYIHLQHLMGLPFSLVGQIHRRGIPYVITLHDFWWVCANAQLLTNYDQTLCDGPNFYLNCARCVLARGGRDSLWPALPGVALPLAYRNARLRRILQSARRLIAPTRFVQQWYARHGVEADHISVLPHGLPLPDTLSAGEAKPHRPVRLAYIGGLSWQKGVHIVLEALQGLEAETPNFELWIAGDEAANPEYAAQLHSLAGPQVRFLGRLSRAQVWETLAQVDLLLVPSLWYETFSLIISEAFAAGVPVMASWLGPLAERVQHNVDGWLVEAGDVSAWRAALARVSQSPAYIQTWQANIQPGLSLAEHVQALNALYQA